MWKHFILLLLAVIVLSPEKAQAQFNPISFPRLVPHKSAAPPAATAAKPQKASSGDDYHRLLEILIELAWLGDPLTYPCLLEARFEGGALRVRGKTPDDAVREQALKLARLNCPMKVIDETKPGPATVERSTRVSPLVLQQAAQSMLREAMPGGGQCGANLRIRCETDGKVVIDGHVKSFADKLAISKMLQRLHGCTSVVNQLEVCLTPPAASANAPAISAPARNETLPLVLVRKKPQSRFRTLLCMPGKSTRAPASSPPGPLPAALASAAPLAPANGIQRVGYNAPAPKLDFAGGTSTALSDAPYETHGVVILPDGEPAAMSAHQLKERIYRVCGPSANNVGVQFKSPTEVDIILHSRSPAEASRMARLIMQIPELMTYRVDIRVKLLR